MKVLLFFNSGTESITVTQTHTHKDRAYVEKKLPMFSYTTVVFSDKYNASLIFSNLDSSTRGERRRFRNFLMLKRKDFAFSSSSSSSILPMSLDVYKYKHIKLVLGLRQVVSTCNMISLI